MAKPKKTFVLRMDADTWAAVEKWAADEFRSVNGQLEYLIVKALKDAKREKSRRTKMPPNIEDVANPDR